MRDIVLKCGSCHLNFLFIFNFRYMLKYMCTSWSNVSCPSHVWSAEHGKVKIFKGAKYRTEFQTRLMLQIPELIIPGRFYREHERPAWRSTHNQAKFKSPATNRFQTGRRRETKPNFSTRSEPVLLPTQLSCKTICFLSFSRVTNDALIIAFETCLLLSP